MKLRKDMLMVAAIALVLVAGASKASAPSGRYASSNNTVLDTKTKLTWQQTLSPNQFTWGGATTLGAAQYYCANLVLNGGGWRVPTVKELLTIVDYSVTPSNNVPTIDAAFFPNTPASYFWSATPRADQAGQVWGVDFSTGLTNNGYTQGLSPSGSLYVRCVR
jgi:hypothetical protein